jgi:molybdopterin synthase catalytic subunit
MFKLTHDPLDSVALRRALADPDAGACVTFEGWVRNSNEGRKVLRLQYEAHGALAELEGNRILAEARSRFPLTGAVAVHRAGTLGIGEAAVWVGVTGEHRDEAFSAARFIIDEIKARVPIWKKEHYADGSSEWLNCATRGEHAKGEPPA